MVTLGGLLAQPTETAIAYVRQAGDTLMLMPLADVIQCCGMIGGFAVAKGYLPPAPPAGARLRA